MRSAGHGESKRRIQRDQETGIETIRARFEGHAYDLHDHDDYLVGVTEQGLALHW